jgi:hypothetical protein
MVHHAAPERGRDAIALVGPVQGREEGRRARVEDALQRRWLHIGESLVAAEIVYLRLIAAV